MNLLFEKFLQLLSEKDDLLKYDTCVRFIGDLKLLSIRIRKFASKLMIFTKDYKIIILSICMRYLSSDEFRSDKLYNSYYQNLIKDEIS